MARLKGLLEQQEWHSENTGLPYKPFKLEDKKTAIVRVLFTQDDIEGLYIHRAFGVISQTRCAAPGHDKDPDICPLCKAEVPRTIRTFIPVRVRGDEKPDRVQWIEYGREGLDELIAVLNEFITQNPECNITSVDWKIMRMGQKLDTKYKWFAQMNTLRPLSNEEVALVPDPMDEIWPVRDEDDLAKRAMEFMRKKGATAVPQEGEAGEESIPF